MIGKVLFWVVIPLGSGFVIVNTPTIFSTIAVLLLVVTYLFMTINTKKLSAILVFSLPFLNIVVLHTPIADFRLPQFILIETVLVMVLRRLGGNIRKYRFDLPLALFVIFGFASALQSSIPAIALKNAIEMIELVLLFRIIVWLGADHENLNSMVSAVILSTSVLIIAALTQVISQGVIVFPSFIINFPNIEIISNINPFVLQEIGHGIVRRVGVFGLDPVGFSSAILGILPLFLFKASAYRNKLGYKIQYFFMFASGIFVILFTYSRSPMIVLVFSLFIYAILLKKIDCFI